MSDFARESASLVRFLAGFTGAVAMLFLGVIPAAPAIASQGGEWAFILTGIMVAAPLGFLAAWKATDALPAVSDLTARPQARARAA